MDQVTVLPALDDRLKAAAELISAELHTDVGSDHASLPIWLLHTRRAGRVVIVEKTVGPLEVARQAVGQAGMQARAALHLGDGLAPLATGELESVSLTGMGTRTMLGILERGRAAAQWPSALVVQPNDGLGGGAGRLRQWAAVHGYWLVAERLAAGYWRYPVLRFERRGSAEGRAESVPDPAYDGLPVAAALGYGPHLLRAAHPLLVEELRAQLVRLEGLEPHARPEVLSDLHTVRAALSWLGL